MKTQQLEIDNCRPEDATYPTFEPAEFQDGILFVSKGQYLIDIDGDIIIATTSNMKWKGDDSFVACLNKNFFRAKYLGCRDDFLQCANQVRKATAIEIESATMYTPSLGAKITSNGQVALL